MPDGTKVIIAMGMLPLSTNPSVRLALKGIRDYASFKDTLRENVRFLEEHGGAAIPAPTSWTSMRQSAMTSASGNTSHGVFRSQRWSARRRRGRSVQSRCLGHDHDYAQRRARRGPDHGGRAAISGQRWKGKTAGSAATQ